MSPSRFCALCSWNQPAIRVCSCNSSLTNRTLCTAPMVVPGEGRAPNSRHTRGSTGRVHTGYAGSRSVPTICRTTWLRIAFRAQCLLMYSGSARLVLQSINRCVVAVRVISVASSPARLPAACILHWCLQSCCISKTLSCSFVWKRCC